MALNLLSEIFGNRVLACDWTVHYVDLTILGTTFAAFLVLTSAPPLADALVKLQVAAKLCQEGARQLLAPAVRALDAAIFVVLQAPRDRAAPQPRRGHGPQRYHRNDDQ